MKAKVIVLYCWRCIVTWWTNTYDLDSHYDIDSVIEIKRYGKKQFDSTNKQIKDKLAAHEGKEFYCEKCDKIFKINEHL